MNKIIIGVVFFINETQREDLVCVAHTCDATFT